jgi:hypothetical protein
MGLRDASAVLVQLLGAFERSIETHSGLNLTMMPTIAIRRRQIQRSHRGSFSDWAMSGIVEALPGGAYLAITIQGHLFCLGWF